MFVIAWLLRPGPKLPGCERCGRISGNHTPPPPLTLHKEGHSKITKLMVEQRSEVLGWAFSFVGIPFGGGGR